MMQRVKILMILVILVIWAANPLAIPAVGQDQPVEDPQVEDPPVIIHSSQTKGRNLLRKSIQDNSTDLDKLRDQIDQHRQRIKNLDSQEAEVRRGHEEIQQEIELSRKLVGDMIQQEIMLQERSRLLKSELEIRFDC